MGSWDTGILFIHPTNHARGVFISRIINTNPVSSMTCHQLMCAKKRLQWDLFQGKPVEVSSMHHRPRNCKIWLFFFWQSVDLFVPMKNVSKLKVRKKEQHTNRDAELIVCNQEPICKTSHWHALKASPLNKCPMPMSHTVPIILYSTAMPSTARGKASHNYANFIWTKIIWTRILLNLLAGLACESHSQPKLVCKHMCWWIRGSMWRITKKRA